MSSLASRLSLSLAAALGGCAMPCRACGGAQCGATKSMAKCGACKAKQ